MDSLFLIVAFAIGIVCAVAITAVACIRPKTSGAYQAADVHESHALEAPTH